MRSQRVQARALIAELVAVAVLAGLGPELPRGVDAGAGWSFLSAHAFELAHAALGAAVLAQAIALTISAARKPVPALVLAGVVIAVCAGIVYVSNGQPGSALTVMTVGWLVSLTAAVVHYLRERRRPRVASTDQSASSDPRRMPAP